VQLIGELEKARSTPKNRMEERHRDSVMHTSQTTRMV